MVTFSNLIESKGKTEGEIGDLSMNISKALRRVGSSKEGVVKGLPGGAIQGGDVEWVRGGKFSRLKGGGGVTTRRGVCEGDRGSTTNSLRDREEDKAIVSTSLINSSSSLVRSPTEVGKDES